MSAQLSMFLPPAPAQRSSATSVAAARAIEGKARGAQCRAVLGYLIRQGGATREEISLACGIKIQSVCARVADLIASGDILESGDIRRTSTGRAAAVLVVA